MLEELYNLARRLEDRVETVERLVASDHPDFRPNRLAHELSHDRQIENRSTRDFDQMVSNKGRIGQ
jgi:phage shock protein B